MNTHSSRRQFIRKASLAAGGIILTPNFISCNNDDDTLTQIDFDTLTDRNFDFGVASFDPTNSSVIIWTRYSTTEATADITWQVSTDANFNNILREGVVTTDANRDYTVSIEVQELDPGLKLYYRFANGEDDAKSDVGETLTFSNDAAEVKFAITSCANFASGFFHVYTEMANSDADVIIHLGDYIYEYGQGEYGTTPFTDTLGRTPEPGSEIISLGDYRTRYRQYRSDSGLKLAHQKKPFIAVWDDHEVTNDAYIDGAENHQEDEGSFEARKQAALQAYSEYMPARTNNSSIIYRSFQIGNLVNLIMLDTRLIGRTKQLDYGDYIDNQGNLDAVAFQTDLLDPTRTLLGETQLNWLLSEIQSSSAQWQVLGQQVLMGRMNVPAELLVFLGAITAELEATGTVSDATLIGFNTALTELVTLKVRALNNDPTLTEGELLRLNTEIPYNLDAWDGYPIEREAVLAALQGRQSLVLAGDTHNAWSNTLKTQDGSMVATEFATSSVSSPGFEQFLGTDPATIAGFEQAIVTLIDDLNYFDASQRGFNLVTINGSGATSQWIFVSDILSEAYAAIPGPSLSV